MISTSYLNTGIAFLGNLILAYLLSPRDFGVFSLASSLLLFVFMFAGFGSQESIIQCRDEQIEHLVSTAFWISISLSCFLAILGSSVGIIVINHYDSSVVYIIIALSWLNVIAAISQSYAAVLKREMRYKPVALAQTAATAISFILAILVAWLGGRYWALLIRQSALIFIRWYAFKKASQYRLSFNVNREAAKWIWKFGWQLMTSRIAEVFLDRGDKLLVGAFLGETTLGYYSLAYRLSLVGTEFTQNTISSVTHSLYATVQHSKERLALSFERAFLWLSYVTPLLGVIVFLTGEEIVVSLYGQKWAIAAVVFRNMAPFLGLLPLRENLRYFLVGSGHVNDAVKVLSVQVLFTAISITSVLATGYGIITVVWCVNIGLLFSFFGMIYYTSRVVTIDWGRILLKPLGYSLFAGLIGFSLPALEISSGFLLVLMQVIIPSFIYLAILMLLERHDLWNEFKIIRSYLQ